MTDRRIINEACCYLTLSKAREKRGAEEKGERLPTLVFLVKMVSLCFEGFLQQQWEGREERERKKGRRANKVTRWEKQYKGVWGKSV